jgi:RecA/RadA recombinase
MGVFDDLMKSTKNDLGGLASKGVITGDSTSWLDTGSYALNALISGSIYGGFPMGKVSGLNAPQAAGKTFFLLTTVKEFLDKNPTGAVFYFESESAVSKQMLEERGIDTKRVYVLPVTTIQEFRNQAIKILDGYKASGKTREDRPPMIMCLDSLGMLSTSKEVEDIAEGKDTRDMTRTQLIKGAFRVLTLKLGEVDVPLILTNHVYASMDMYSPPVISGGSGILYAASTLIGLSKRKLKEGTEQIGNDIRCTLYKSRFTKETSQVFVGLHYDTGLDRYHGLLDIAEATGVFVKDGTRFSVNGKKVFGTTIAKNPEEYFTKEVLDLIDSKCKKEFCYGQGKTEETIDEVLGRAEAPIDEETGEILE